MVHRPEGGFRPAEPASERYAFLGVRGCDLASIGILGRVLGGGAHPDGAFARTRQALFVVAVNCTEPGGACFCASMGTGPAAGPGYDLALTEQIDESGHWFVAEAGPPRVSASWRRFRTAALPLRKKKWRRQTSRGGAADGAGHAPGRPARADPEVRGVTALGRRRQQVPDLRQLHHGVPHLLLHHDRGRHRPDRRPRGALAALGSCFELDFSYLHGGPRAQRAHSRYRQWITHKLGTWHDQFGSSGCVGCGRCIAWCPVGIDITEEAARLAGPDPDPGQDPDERRARGPGG